MSPAAIRGLLYDGRTSAAQLALLDIRGSGATAQLSVRAGGRELQVAVATVMLGERVGETPRHVALADGGTVEVLDNAEFDAALERAGLTTAEAPLRRLEGRWRYALLALLATALGTIAFLRYGMPALAARAVRFIPPRVDTFIGTDTLRVLDTTTFRPSRLTAQRQADLQRVFREVAAGAGPDGARYRLELRHGGRLGANAFALPSGVVVLTDELAQLANNDDELRGVFAHEVGHLVNRHAMRMLVQDSGAALLVVGVFGDASGVSALAATAPTVLVDAAYSRDFEREADAFAFHWMRGHGVPPERLGELLQRLSSRQGAGEMGFLASHPDLQERLRASKPAGQATPGR